MPRILFRPLVLLAALAATAHAAAAQNACNLIYQRGNYTVVGAEGSRIVNAQGPLLVRCTNGEELRADSAELFQAQNEVHLFRQVDYQDPGKALTSDMATYNSATGRLYATGNVVFTDKSQGSTLRGPELEYFRAMAGRPQSQATALQRPHVTVTPRGGTGGTGGTRRRSPMEIDGDRVTSVGDRYMTATGNVVIEDNGTRSTAEEAYYDQVAGHVELRRQARVNNERYQLSGDFITSDLQNGSVSKVLAQANARMVSERLTVTGPQLQLFFERDLLQRMISGHQPGAAVADSAAARSVALSKGFRLEADSIEAVTPEQQVRQVNAVGKARGESWDTLGAVRVLVDTGAAARPDTATRVLTRPPTALDEKDVLTADTIIAFFRGDSAGGDSATRGRPRVVGRPAAAPRDSGLARPGAARATQAAGDTAKTEIERLLAIGDAHSIYRTRNDSTRPASQQRPGINYLAGDRIDLRFVAGEVDVAHVRGLKQGLYLDPAQPGDSTAAADSAAAAGRTGAGVRTGAAGRRGTSAGARPSTARPASPTPAAGTRGGTPPATAPVPATPARPLSLLPSAHLWTGGTASRASGPGSSPVRWLDPLPRGGL
jgi:lipopolysaccharide export system protein LptA